MKHRKLLKIPKDRIFSFHLNVLIASNDLIKNAFFFLHFKQLSLSYRLQEFLHFAGILRITSIINIRVNSTSTINE
uniref:Ovule protein n=1 Tax=Ascaris lumbricoides TaxID=6252 RepID=A0A9J2PTA2_ASCLU